jgi:hypothetical protein
MGEHDDRQPTGAAAAFLLLILYGFVAGAICAALACWLMG